jgi:hypothetical protein
VRLTVSPGDPRIGQDVHIEYLVHYSGPGAKDNTGINVRRDLGVRVDTLRFSYPCPTNLAPGVRRIGTGPHGTFDIRQERIVAFRDPGWYEAALQAQVICGPDKADLVIHERFWVSGERSGPDGSAPLPTTQTSPPSRTREVKRVTLEGDHQNGCTFLIDRAGVRHAAVWPPLWSVRFRPARIYMNGPLWNVVWREGETKTLGVFTGVSRGAVPRACRTSADVWGIGSVELQS